MRSFSVSFTGKGPVTVLNLAGDLDAYTVGELEAALDKCLSEGQVCLVLNGARLQHIASAGLGAILGYIEAVRGQGGDIVIAALQPNVANVFDLLGLPLLLPVVDTEEEAIAKFHD